MTPIRTLLVANRGEIARRVIRTARSMGIRTVAVYSDPDASAPHVSDADVAVPLGGSSSAQTYLDVTKILDAVRRSGADAVHPGYGFLSENADFATQCEKAGVIFVGPAPDTIREMGRKDRAKDVARKAGVPVLPDALLSGEDPERWLAAASEVGYPLLVKAVAGGGGKGMRLVGAADELVDAVTSARREAGSSFGDTTVFCERYLAAARHIEIQVFGDSHRNAVHLGERECSVQRRHQKVLEESPSPAVDTDLRGRMGDRAVALVRELGYLGAGTVEFLLDEHTGEFHFLEMNTRLQVEHPVTEEVTGLDLVRLQLDIAQGLPLDLPSEGVPPRGHAIEVRLYAEDTTRDFLPTPGPLFRYHHPDDLPGVRFEDGVRAPGDVPAFYDPMLAKVIAHGISRQVAAARLAAALETMQIHGTITNRDFLVALLRDQDFLAGDTRTDFLDHHPDLLTAGPAVPRVVHLAAAIAVSVSRRRGADPLTGLVPPGFRCLPGSPLTHAQWSAPDGEPFHVQYRLSATTRDARFTLVLDGDRHELLLRELHRDGVRVQHAGVEHPCAVVEAPDGTVWVNSPGGQTGWAPQERLPEPTSALSATGPVAELPGTVVAVLVRPGDRVHAGQSLVIVEAMKMEHPALAAAEGVVTDVHVTVGQYVEAKTELVTLTDAESA